jgi:hypothetical protein
MPKTRTNTSRSGTAQRKRASGAATTRRHGGAASGSHVIDHEPRKRHAVKRAASTIGEKVGKVDLEKAMVLLHTALAIALVIKQRKNRTNPRKAEPFRSALGVLNYYLNGESDLTEMQRATLEDIKDELRALYAREDSEMSSARS